MVTHIVMWNWKEELTQEERKETGAKLKTELLALREQIPGIRSLRVVLNELPTSSRDIALIGEYDSVEALNAYTVHPLHQAVAAKVKEVTCNRTCLDFES